MGEHLACFLSGEYTTYDAEALSRGEYHIAGGGSQGPNSWAMGQLINEDSSRTLVYPL